MFLKSLTLFLVLIPSLAFAQDKAFIYGTITNEKGKPVSDVTVVIVGEAGVGTTTTSEGYYGLEVPAGDTLLLGFSAVGYGNQIKSVFPVSGGSYRMNVSLVTGENELGPVVITESRRNELIMSIPIEEIEYIPDPSGDPIIAILKKYVTSNNELSAQYSVRGGNYDENLVYVNDFEIYRPLLVRSGQQEGLPFPNYDLVGNITFSAGGFEARYGDKLSSVLDIQYKRPDSLEAGVSASLLGGSFFMNNRYKDDTANGSRSYFLFGTRHKTNQYLLGSLQTTGEYRPVFFDVQGLWGHDFSDHATLEVLANLSSSQYSFVPLSRSTTTGVVNNVIRLDVFFEGQEITRFLTGFTGVSYQYRPNNSTGYKILASAYRSLEDETFDIIGDYWLGDVETNLGDENFNEVVASRGSGTIQNFGRNYLDVLVLNLGHEGYHERGAHYIRWGGRLQGEQIQDDLKEWEMLDSAGYSLPYTNELVSINSYYRSLLTLESLRANAYVQDTWNPGKESDFYFTYGVRSSYWTINDEVTITPRVQAAWKPNWYREDSSKVDIVWKAALGMYNQPPFYRELRNQEGLINYDVVSQKSIHALVSADYNFRAWNRDFKFIAEAYYKYLYDLVPYDVDNLRIRYFGQNMANGFATGLDLRLHGEIVEDADSWVSLSLLRTMENLEGDSTYIDTDPGEEVSLMLVEQGNIRRPTDQFLTFGMFFQDYMPGNKNFKVHLNFLFGTGFVTGPPGNPYLRSSKTMPPYRRVDIGFSALLLDKKRERGDKIWSDVESLWAGIEVFNLLGIQNTISYLWVEDLNNEQYAFPNYLTDRRINFRLIMKI